AAEKSAGQADRFCDTAENVLPEFLRHLQHD
ncbi:MAG: hypothetical protein ACI9NT_002827, partial [Bacteroidia bacterium]